MDETRPRLLSIKKAAAYLGVPYGTLYSLAMSGRLAYVQAARHGRIFFEPEELDAWIEAHRVAARERPRPVVPPATRRITPAEVRGVDVSDLMSPEARRLFM